LQTQATLKQGESLQLGAYSMTYESLAEFPTADGRDVARATISVYKNGNYLTELHPRRDFYIESRQPMTIPGVRSTWEDDFYVLLVDWKDISAQGATFKVFHNPLVKWVWGGGWVFILGTFIAAWPEKEKKKVAGKAAQPVKSPVQA